MKEKSLVFTVTLLDEMHTGTGVGRLGLIDDTQSRAQTGKPIVWASTLIGLLREAGEDWLMTLKAAGFDKEVAQKRAALARLFGQRGNDRHVAVIRSLSLAEGKEPWFHIWASTARGVHSRRPAEGTLRFVECARGGLTFSGEFRVAGEKADVDLELLKTCLTRMPSLGAGKTRGWGRIQVKVGTLQGLPVPPLDVTWKAKCDALSAGQPVRLRVLLRNLEPLNLSRTAFAGNLIHCQSYLPGATLRGALLHWLSERDSALAERLADPDLMQVTNGYYLPTEKEEAPTYWQAFQVLPLPLTLEETKGGEPTTKPTETTAEIAPTLPPPWWVSKAGNDKRLGVGGERDQLVYDELSEEKQKKYKGQTYKRVKTEEYLIRGPDSTMWERRRPKMGVVLRNAVPTTRLDDDRSEVLTDRPIGAEKMKEDSLFSEEVIWEAQRFIAELWFASKGDAESWLKRSTALFQPVDNEKSWLRVGRKGRPVCIEQIELVGTDEHQAATTFQAVGRLTLTLTSDLIVRDSLLRFRTEMDAQGMADLLGLKAEGLECKSKTESVEVYGFNSATGLPRAAALALKRGSVFVFTPSTDPASTAQGKKTLAEWQTRLRALEQKGQGLGERAADGYGRFVLDLDVHAEGYWQQFDPVEVKEPSAKPQEREQVLQKVETFLNEHKNLLTKGREVPTVSQWQWLRGNACNPKGNWDKVFTDLSNHAETPAGRRRWPVSLVLGLKDAAEAASPDPAMRHYFIEMLVRRIVMAVRAERGKSEAK